MVYLGWLQLALIIVAAGALLGAALGGLASNRWFARLEKVAPRPRFALLTALALMPAALGALALGVSFAPSVLDALGLVADHCGHHGGHAFHLCFIHGHPPAASPLVLGAALVISLWFFAGWSEELELVRATRAWGERLLQLGHYDDDIDGWTVASERPVAVTYGLLEPRICVSERLREVLSPAQFEAVLAHERAHAKRFDSLVKLVARMSARLHFPFVRQRLLSELDLASEQACDEAAAEAVGDRLTVAEAILTVERSFEGTPPPASALAFGAKPLERRVRAMLEGNWRRPSWLSLTVFGLLGAGLLLTSYDLLHHTIESLLALVF
ncbi:hypothetical protein FIV42_01655 [Persicimonas caeni]|uniref:Peptidase M56 domain-containing protein n=1 Tax=Persicimonas caeni TaxID=2292766 RepID=A0A4Y6PN92_PERCE|nr:M56 family metallopeptidase [Persicimonas caeni]QDG49487.1 hypothetical protein FIV42_01655 [Persicimonas caeni]QED30708.1 M48 family metalloprotease [Persicimonas caeni]